MSKFLKKSNEKGIIHIQSTQNNTLLTLTDLQGNVKFWSSAGTLGFNNSRKSTSYAAQAAAEMLATKAINLGFHSIIIQIKGLGYGKLTAIRAIYKSKLSVLKIQECTPLAHNGCRPPKKRRV
jgi:small subunit ribosomal protein S11|uniref:Ribosomal protein S11 n=2 Tax=Chlorella vulgaris TaxID=3077 RepID=A0A650ANJ5_CHLVU|nr:ribosomal protein S11 [Chlorella vulgaris]QGN75004.1 ribosomal protein S11 [Chlorella vulgaris]